MLLAMASLVRVRFSGRWAVLSSISWSLAVRLRRGVNAAGVVGVGTSAKEGDAARETRVEPAGVGTRLAQGD